MRTLGLLLTMFLLVSFLALAQQPEGLLTPDPAVLKQVVLDLCGKARAARSTDTSQIIKSREIVRLEKESYLVPPSPEHSDLLPVYVVQVEEHAEWYKASSSYIFVFFVDAGQWVPILVYAGGFNENELSFEFISIHDAAKFYDSSGSHYFVPLKTLLVRDKSSGTGTSSERLLLFRFDPKEKRMVNVLDQVIGFSARPKPYEDFESAIAFKRAGGFGHLDDLVVTTKWLVSMPEGGELDGPGSTVDTRESVFRWNGQKYEGQMNVPEEAPPGVIEEVWKPDVFLEELGQPLPSPPVQGAGKE